MAAEEGLLQESRGHSKSGIGEVLLSDEDAYENIAQNKIWMLGGYIHKTHKKDVEKAFELIKADIAISEGANGEVEDMIAGPGVLWAFLSNAMTWTTFVIVTVASTFFVDVEHGIAQKPQGRYLIFGILIWLAFTFAALIPEYKALMYCLPTQCVCVPRKAEGKGASQPFNRWMISMFVISIALHADIYTTAIFMGRVWKSLESCYTLNNLWRLAVCNSFIHHIPIVNELTYGQLCFVSWCLMFSQIIYALCYSVPISPNVAKHMDISSAYVSYSMTENNASTQRYDTFMKKDTGHGRCLQALSESGRMCSLNWQDDLYLQQAEREWDCQRVHDEMRRTNFRFLLFCIQATFIPNLQITFLGYQRAELMQSHGAGGASTDWLTIISFTISVLCGLHYIYYEFGSVRRHQKYARRAIHRQKMEAKEKKNGRKHWEAHLLHHKVNFSVASNYVFTFVFCGMFCFILLKATMAIAVCDSGIWNFHTPASMSDTNFLTRGCVNLTLVPPMTCALNATQFC